MTSSVTYCKDEIKKEICKTAKTIGQILDSEIVTEVTQVNGAEGIQPFYVPRVSSFRTVVGAFARIKQFVANYKLRKSNGSGQPLMGRLTVAELKDVKRTVLIIVQRESFSGIEDIRLRDMNVFMAEDGLIRMKSKMLERDDDFSFRCPTVLLGENTLVWISILKAHICLGHVPVSTLLNNLREEHWIIHGRRVARRIVRKCVVCARQSVREPGNSLFTYESSSRC